MTDSYTTTFTTERSPQEVFDAICDVQGWWTGNIDGRASEVGDEFTYEVPGVHRTRQRVIALEPGRLVTWAVLDSDLSSFDDAAEWTGTTITFAIEEADGATRVQFTHEGLVPEFECYEACSNGWHTFVAGSLRAWVEAGATGANEYTDGTVEFVRGRMAGATA